MTISDYLYNLLTNSDLARFEEWAGSCYYALRVSKTRVQVGLGEECSTSSVREGSNRLVISYVRERPREVEHPY